ncbi:polysaccharide biosynthesis protein [Corynebacterium sp. MNWGS58]|uniref:hypothetical protein n=1 Tax=Corynebacterium sp. 102791.4 TaxID=3104612 RepID=UPI003513ED19
MRWMTVAMVFAAASGYVVMVLAAAVLGTDGADRWLVFWSSFFAVAAVANGMLQETTRAVGEAATEPTTPTPKKQADPLRTGAAVGIGLGAFAALSALWWAPSVAPQHSWWAGILMALGIASIFVQQTVAGLLSGTQRWNRYAALLGMDAALRLIIAAVLSLDYLTVQMIPDAGYQIGFMVATVCGAISWIIIIATSRDRAGFLHAAVDVTGQQFWRNSLSAMAATAATALMVTGFPALVDLSLAISPTTTAVPIAALLYCVMLTRAPLLVPLTAFQSAVVMFFLRRREQPLGALRAPAAGLVVLGVVGAGLAWAIGPWLFGLFLDDDFILSGPVLAILTAASVGTALLMVTGSAVLAHQRHRSYTLGWWAAAIAYMLLLLVPLDLVTRSALALAVGPLAGVAWHIATLARIPTKIASD